jgi:hypothetical protein
LSGTLRSLRTDTGVDSILRVDRSMIDWRSSARAAILMAIPLAVATTTSFVEVGVFLTIGCLNVLLLQFVGTPAEILERSAWGLGLNALAIGLGTLVGTLGLLEIPLVAVGLVAVYLVNKVPRPASLSLTVSALFVIGVGLPGGSLPEAGLRSLWVLAGGAVALAGFAGHLALRDALYGSSGPERRTSFVGVAAAATASSPFHLEIGVAAGVTAAAGLALAMWAGLARDYWIMLTVVVVLRASLRQTLEIGVERMVGTVLGAVLAVGVTLGITASPIQGVLLVVFTFATFALLFANYTLFAVFLTAFVVVLLNLVYSGGGLLAETRVLDTVVGGSLALAAAAVLWILRGRSHRAPGRRAADAAVRP